MLRTIKTPHNNCIDLLDVTLRDGGYKTNFHFSYDIVQQIISLLDQSRVRYIEVGYRNGPYTHSPNIGPAGICSSSYFADDHGAQAYL